METSGVEQRSPAQRAVHWRSVGLIGACVAGGVTLSMMVIGSAPTISGPEVAAAQAQSVELDPQGGPVTVAVDPSTTVVVPDAAEPAAEPTEAVVGAATIIQVAPVPVAPAVSGAQVAAPAPAQPAVVLPSPTVSPSPATTATPAPALAPAPAPAPPAPSAPTTAPPAPAPAPTAAPAPTSAAPTTAPAPPPSTAPPSVPSTGTASSYTVSGVATVSLRFDGSSISVASVAPEANWVYEIASNGPRSVEVKFFNVATGRDREFHATVEGGRITVEN